MLWLAWFGAACASPSIGLDGGVDSTDMEDSDVLGGRADAEGPAADVSGQDVSMVVEDGGVARSLEFSEFCGRFAATYVERYASVCGGDAEVLLGQWQSGLACSAELVEAVAARRLTYSATQAWSCLDAVRSAPCSDLIFTGIDAPWTMAESCRGTFSPAVREGEFCLVRECVYPLYCNIAGIPGSDCSDRCRRLTIVPVGARCDAPMTGCVPNARCDYDEARAALVCVAEVKAGGACAQHSECEFGTRCDDNVCRVYRRATLGEVCTDVPCEPQLRCGPARRCVEPPRLGEICVVDSIRCVALSTCVTRQLLDDEGVCSPLSGLGGDCSRPGQRCGQGYCGLGNRCLTPTPEGGRCASSTECEASARCIDGRCNSTVACGG